MKFLFYKIRDDMTGLFMKKGLGNNFTKTGDTWNNKSALSNHLVLRFNVDYGDDKLYIHKTYQENFKNKTILEFIIEDDIITIIETNLLKELDRLVNNYCKNYHRPIIIEDETKEFLTHKNNDTITTTYTKTNVVSYQDSPVEHG